jgi:hypothetical protein
MIYLMFFYDLNLDLSLGTPLYGRSTMDPPQEPSRTVQEDDLTLFHVIYRDFNPLELI